MEFVTDRPGMINDIQLIQVKLSKLAGLEEEISQII